MKVWEVMNRDFSYISESTKLTEARAILRKTAQRCLPIVKEGGRLFGFLTRPDVLKVTSLKSEALAKDFARSHPFIPQDLEIAEAFQRLKEHSLEAAPVVSQEGSDELVAIISLRDILRGLFTAGYSPKARTVNEVMSKEFESCDPNESITKIWSKFSNSQAKAVLVFNPYGMLWGIITPKDLIDQRSWLFAREARKPRTPGKVKRFMTRGVICASAGLPIETVTEFIINNDFTIIPIIDKESNVIGVVSQEDLVTAYLMGAKPGVIPIIPTVVPEIRERVEYEVSKSKLEEVLVRGAIPSPMPKLLVRDYMRSEAFFITPVDTVSHAKRLMLRHKVKYLVMADEVGGIRGIVSLRNMMKKLGAEGPIWKRRSIDPNFIFSVTTMNPPEIGVGDTLEKAANLMLHHDTDCLIVRDPSKKFLGLITKDDLARAFAEHSKGLKVENIMQPSGAGIVNRHHSMAHVIKVMSNNYLDCVVVEDSGKPVGIITESDLIFTPIEDQVDGVKNRRLVWIRRLKPGDRKMARYVKITPLLAEDFMVDIPETVDPGLDAAEAASLMLRHGVDGLPVVKGGVLIGVVTKFDIVRELARRLALVLPERREGRGTTE
jgi:CBS domain-containing protein